MADEYTEYKTPQQSNINLGETIRMTTKSPAVADRIFETYAQAEAYIHDEKSSAIAGLILSVIRDTTFDNDNISRNGLYQVIESKTETIDGVHPLLYLERQTPVQSDWLETNTESMAYIKHKPTTDYGTFYIKEDGTVEETPYAEGYMDYEPPTE